MIEMKWNEMKSKEPQRKLNWEGTRSKTSREIIDGLSNTHENIW